MILSKGWVSFKKLEKHLESADLRQAAHSRVHVQQESFKTFLDPDGNPEHHQNLSSSIPLSTFPEILIEICL